MKPLRPEKPALGIGLVDPDRHLLRLDGQQHPLSRRLLPVLLILWARYSFQAVSMALWLSWQTLSGRPACFRAAHPKFQVVRGLLLLATSAMSFYGVQAMPVAEFTAINMLTPVLVTLLAALGAAGAGVQAALGPGGRRLCRRADRHPSRQRPVRLGRAVSAGRGGLFYAGFQTLTARLCRAGESVHHPLLHRSVRHPAVEPAAGSWALRRWPPCWPWRLPGSGACCC